MPYRSQSEAAYDRQLRRARAIRTRLGGAANLILPFPEKPKHMHQTTYWRLRLTAEKSLVAFLQEASRRIGLPPQDPTVSAGEAG